jgi:putative inorganic carbon (hco3(-)) transporter
MSLKLSAAPRREATLFALLAVLLGSGLGLSVGLSPPLLLVAGVLALAVVVATVAWPELGLGLLVFLTYTRFSDVLVHVHGAPSIVQPLSGLLISVILIRWQLYGERPSGWAPAALLMMLYGLVSFLSLIYAVDTARAEGELLDFAKDALISVIAVALCTKARSLRVALWGLILAGLFMGTVTTHQYLTGSFEDLYWGFGQARVENIIRRVDDFRITGPIGDPNFYAQLLIVIVPLALDRFLNERRLALRLLAGWALAVALLSIIFTFSRGGFLALAIIGLCWIARRSINPLVLLLGLALAVSLAPIVPAGYTDRITSLAGVLPGLEGAGIADASLRGRMSENLTALHIFSDHPVLGVGRGNYATHYTEYALRAGIPVGHTLAAHNLYLEIMAEMGVLGLLAFGLILWVAFRNLRESYQAFKLAGQLNHAALIEAFAIGLIGYLSASMFLHGAYIRSFWLLAGIAFALPKIVRHERPATEPAQTR